MPARVTVHVPCFNHEAYVADALDSILAQTYRDFCILVVDDGSTDGSPAIIRRYAEEFPDRITAIFNPENFGIPRRLQVALDHAHGEFLAFLASDDLWHPHMLSTLVGALDAHPEAGMVHADSEWFDSDSGEGLGLHSEKYEIHSGDVLPSLLDGNFISAITVLVRREAFKETNVQTYPSPLITAADYYMWLSVASKFPILYVPELLSRHRRHPANTSRDMQWMEEYMLCIFHMISRCPWAVEPVARYFAGRIDRLQADVSRFADQAGRLARYEEIYNATMNMLPAWACRALKGLVRSLVRWRRGKEENS